MKFERALYLFYYKNDCLTNKINLDENEDNILEGLIGKEEYINRKKGDASFRQKLIQSLDRIMQKYNLYH